MAKIMNNEERLKRKREAQGRRREQIQNDPERLALENEKRRTAHAKKKEEEKQNPKKETKKEVNERRKKWRVAKQKYLANKKQEDKQCQSTRAASIQKKAKARAASKRVKKYYLVKKLENRNIALERQLSKYKMRYYRLKDKIVNESTSPESVLTCELKRKKMGNISPEVKRRLLFGQSVAVDLGNSLSEVRSNKKKQLISNTLRLKYVKKYRFLSIAKPYFPFSFRSRREVMGVKKKKIIIVTQYVEAFFEDDKVSTLSPSKGDQIVRGKIRKQKRFLTNSLNYWFKKFCEDSEFLISYSTFCKLRPFWVVFRNVNARDTCLCMKCENARLTCKALRRLNIVNDMNIDSLVEKELYCEPVTSACRFRLCNSCSNNAIHLSDYDGMKECYYDRWESNMELGRDNKEHRRTSKNRVTCFTHELVTRFLDDIIPPYTKHKGNDYHQKNAMKILKQELKAEDIMFHVDFAENYATKYADEIQSIHFGGNRTQISLHTGVVYHHTDKLPFCTISRDLNHDPVGIFNHLLPIMEPYYNRITNLHFLSDSPSTQYRNRHMFWILIQKIIPLFDNLQTVNWNFSEAGHGKGAPDGVGSLLKRTCDRVVSHGQDISTFEEFLNCVTERIKGVKITTVNAVDPELEKEMKTHSIAVKGSMKVHQVKWSCSTPKILYFNRLSCFSCVTQCSHFHETRINYNLDGNDSMIEMEVENHLTVQDDPSTNDSESAIVKDQPSIETEPQDETLKEGEWVVVQFDLQRMKGNRKWIGIIRRINENDTFLVEFVRSHHSNLHTGFLYSFPIVKDKDPGVCRNQILYRIPPPTLFQRKMKFSIHCKDL